ncbi:MAG: hypothetical protein ACIAQ0_09195 [Phycisphaerales bacterium JB058]
MPGSQDQETVVEALCLGDVHFRVVQREAGGRKRHTARFAPTEDWMRDAAGYDLCELHELKAAVEIAIGVIRHAEGRCSLLKLGTLLADLLRTHRITSGDV